VSADIRVRFNKNDGGAAFGRLNGGRQPGRTSADNHDVCFLVPLRWAAFGLGSFDAESRDGRCTRACGGRLDEIAALNTTPVWPVFFHFL
jgi:hypothetical protein